MKATMVIPSYWARESGVGWREGDAIYDHPTPLDTEGTLLRTIQSINVLEDKDFGLAVISAPTSEEIETQVESKVASIIRSADIGVQVLHFGPSHLRQIHELLTSEGRGEYADLLHLRGYSNIRNLCIFIPLALGSDVAVLIDDDEVFEDPKFMAKAREFVGKAIEGETVNAITGYFLQADGDYHLKGGYRSWMKYWDQLDRMNEAFENMVEAEPRLKETPCAFGGLMIIHRDLFTVVPFDPRVPRGEDLDYLINAKMFGFNFFSDGELSIKHLPPPKTHRRWMQFREDIYRFVYERAKIERQKETQGMTMVRPEDFDPYPGCFLKKDLDEKIEKSCKLLSEEYLTRGDVEGSEEALNNIAVARTDAVPEFDPFQWLCNLQERWQELMEYTSERGIAKRMRDIIQGS